MEKNRLVKFNNYLLFGTLFFVLLRFGSFVLVPVLFASLLAMLMSPVAHFLEIKGVSRVFSTIICTFIIFVAFCLIFLVVIVEILSLSDDLPLLEEKFNLFAEDLQHKIHSVFNISPEEQLAFLDHQVQFVLRNTGRIITVFLGRITSALGGVLLTLVLSFLFLYQRDRYRKFILKAFKKEDPRKTKEILSKVSKVSQKYLMGRIISIFLITIMYSIGFIIIGLKNAFLLAFFAAFLSIVPYIGTTLGGVIPVFVAFITEPHWVSSAWVVVVIVGGQIIDDYFIEPSIVGGRVSLSAASSLIVLIVGGLVWGISGLILAIPLLGIAKIIFDHIDSLKHFGYLIGAGKNNKKKKM